MSQELRPVEVCPICDGVGLVRAMNASGQWVSKPCECQEGKREYAHTVTARIPPLYEDVTLDNFETGFVGAHGSISGARMLARQFVEKYVRREGNGLLFIGGLGTGKTHLAVAILRQLIKERKIVTGYFCDHGTLIKDIQMSFNPENTNTEFGILKPVLESEVLVLDDLGAMRPTDWVRDGLLHILSTRYNNKLSTIVTTNYLDLPTGAGNLFSVERAARESTLGERIGDRLLSRLAQMCITVNMHGQDFRKNAKRANMADLELGIKGSGEVQG